MPKRPHSARLLLVEDNPQVVAVLEQVLGAEGYDLRVARDGDEGLDAAVERTPDLLIVDVGLPGRDGLSLTEELRRRGITAPILLLTARDAVSDRVTGLDAGADDYVSKPFHNDELLARVRALLRRTAAGTRGEILRAGDLSLDPVTHSVWRNGRALALTQREFALLAFLMRNLGRAVTRQQIAEEVWHQVADDADDTNVVDVYVAYLRKKLDLPGRPSLLQTVRGVGYALRVSGQVE